MQYFSLVVVSRYTVIVLQMVSSQQSAEDWATGTLIKDNRLAAGGSGLVVLPYLEVEVRHINQVIQIKILCHPKELLVKHVQSHLSGLLFLAFILVI